MSAATRSTVGSLPRDFMTEIAAGPPAPVTSTRTCRSNRSWSDTWYLHGGIRICGCCTGRLFNVRPVTRGGHPCPAGHTDRLAGHRGLADHLECLGVPPSAEPRPVAGGGLDQVRLQVGPHLDLGGKGVDRPELALQVLVDVHEAGGPEVDRGRR